VQSYMQRHAALAENPLTAYGRLRPGGPRGRDDCDVDRSRRFYTEVLGGEAVLEGELSIVALANGWITISVGGGPTDDKPTVTLEPPSDPGHASSFLNVRVADIAATYKQWSARGAQFLTPPIDRGGEIRCYMRDPDGHLIEVGQLVGRPDD
jgi:catechol 2,3-dioxygenase-like lactoylglutathione lyase family enzyme